MKYIIGKMSNDHNEKGWILDPFLKKLWELK